MLKIKLTGGDRLIEALKNKPSTIRSIVSMKMTALMYQLATFILAKKLTGSPLQTRTGKLAASVNVVPTSIQGEKITGAVEAASESGPGFYGQFHEKGGRSAYQIM